MNNESLYKTQSKASETSKQWFRKFAKSYPPYNFTVNYSKIMIGTIDGNSPAAVFGKHFAGILNLESDKDINEDMRLVELEKDLIPLVENTDNNIFYRKLFFPSIFLNNDFNFEGLLVKGIYITECYTEENSNSFYLHVPQDKINDYCIFAVAVDLELACEFYASIALVNKSIGEQFTDSKEENKRMFRLADFMRNIICNVIDMVEGNDQELNVTTIATSKEQNNKRSKKGQIKIPTKVFIRAKGELKKYVSEFNREISKYSHSFPVRGHWRHFRDDRYVNMKGEKIWIKPTIKGVGIFKAKDYKIVS